MRTATFAAEAQVEAEHWWFVGRRKLFAEEIARAQTPRDCRALDLGTSTGANLRLLRDLGFTDVTGVDLSDEAIRWCAEKKLGPVRKADILDLPFPEGYAGLVLATDVLEHVDDDAGALAEVTRVLRPGGVALITVPAFELLWGFQDEVAHHKRRYRKSRLEALVRSSGLSIETTYYFNYLLFVPILVARQAMRLVRPNIQSENELNAPWLNVILRAIFTVDVVTAAWLHPPIGVSAFIRARKPA